MNLFGRYFVPLLIAVGVVLPASAEDCEQQPNMAAIRNCVDKQIEQQLATAYEDTLNFVRSKDQKAADLLVDAQTSWEQFAQDSCNYTVAARQTERMANDARLNCRATFVGARIKVLKAYRQEFGHAD
ncbi:MAG TPA: lysozyme inhibitor LprI family protein [Dyella sp.]|uniref:lysozyme inhibitor LprI family protein n=1 Tax=Dyella sp. TaxID=1869338 RepID=UPI002F9549C7